MADDRMRITVNFRSKDKDLYDYALKKSEIIGASAYIKTLIKEDMDKDKGTSQN